MDGFAHPVQEEPEVTARTYACTFGNYTDKVWTDRRRLTWDALATILTDHQVGSKDGTCFVPATFTGDRRHKNDAARIDVVVLDSDAGFTLDEIRDAIAAQGWAAVISSTHSHLSTRTRAGRGNWDKFLLSATDQEPTPAAFLVAKGLLPEVADGAEVAELTDEYVFFAHQPCPKFRIALPLLRPWLAASYDKQTEANAAWKERIEALAAVLHLDHDQACTDTSRLFYLPRRPAEGPSPETAVLEGKPCDLFSLPAAPSPEPASRARASSGPRGSAPPRSRTVKPEFTDPETGEVVDLKAWARRYAARFEIVTALQTRRPETFVPRLGESPKRHIRCVNEDAHTQAGADAATFVVNASQGSHKSFVYHCRHGHCDGQDRLGFLRQMLEKGWLKIPDLTDRQFLSGTERPVIRLAGGEIPAIVDAAEDALLHAELGVYQRGPYIVRPGTVMVKVAQERDVMGRQIFEVEEHALAEALTRAAGWEKFDARSESWVTIDAPLKVAATYRERKGAWRLPVLSGLINAPTLRPDGSVLAEPGYDRATGLLLETGGVQFPSVPEAPDWEEGRQAISVLMGLIETFPFMEETDRAVALSTILTACIRRSLPTAPLHAFTAPVMGSGKSKLVDLACLIATGREAAVMSQGKTEEEFEKRLGSLLLAGETVIPIDNCEAALGGEFLCTVLTQTKARTRILGRSETPELPTNALITATGNNLVLSGDMTRRAVMARLDPGCERPELRVFSIDPLAEIRVNRPRYLIAALTVLRAYHVAGRPKQRNPLGSFEEWSRTVRDALVWLDLSDPVETMDVLRASDPGLDALVAVIIHWSQVLGGKKVTVREIIDAAADQVTVAGVGTIAAPRYAFRHPDFREALLAVAGDSGAINSRRLGKWLGTHHGRIVNGRRIDRLGLSGGNLQWQLTTMVEEQREAA
ncbi:hypothetical protein [Roseomonas sp. WA12]